MMLPVCRQGTHICHTRRRSRPQHVRRSGRHPDYIKLREEPFRPAEVRPRPNVEADVRYRRVDFSGELAAEARLGFASCLAAGEAGLQLARAALLVAAEDDAIASSSTVRFPVESFMARITHLTEDIAHALAAAAAAAASQQQQQLPSSSSSSSSSGGNEQWGNLRSLPPQQVVAAIEHTLFKQQPQQLQQRQRQQSSSQAQQQVQQQAQSLQPQRQAWFSDVRCAGFSMPRYGRSNLPKRTLLDHPGVWEDARLGYLNEVLVKKQGCPAALVILYCEVMQQLLLMGAIDFAVTFDYNDFATLPTATPLYNLHLPQLMLSPPEAAAAPGAAPEAAAAAAPGDRRARVLNTCSSDALAELLRHLKRSYWPFPWDTNIDCPDKGGRASLGGFRAAAKAALGSDDISAALRAVSATAAHRLQRGIWTSPGAGDLSRCLAASERLVMMVGDEQPQERRDLAVLLLHAGQPRAAAAELSSYLDCVRSGGVRLDPFDGRLVDDLWKMMEGVKPDREVMSVEKVFNRGMPSSSTSTSSSDSDHDSDGQQVYKPLTW